MCSLVTDDPVIALRSLVLAGQDSPLATVTVQGMSDALGGERGICAARTIKTGETIFTIDHRFHLTEENCPKALAKIIEEGADEQDTFLLKMICVLHQCKSLTDESSASTRDESTNDRMRILYFKSLPTSFSHMPLFFSEDTLQSFGPCFPLQKLTATMKKQAHSCLSFLQDLPMSSAFSKDSSLGCVAPSLEFVNWAVCCLNSRLVGVTNPSKVDEKDVLSRRLIPFGDLLNHSFRPSLSHTVTSEGGLVFKAARDIAEGEELTLKYHDEVDADPCSFLLHYGFWPSSAAAEMRVFFRVAIESEELERSNAALAPAIVSLGLNPSPDMALGASFTHPLPALWIWLLRLCGMSEEQRAAFTQGQVEVPVDVEREGWLTIRRELEENRRWYLENGVETATGEAGSSGAAAEAGKDDTSGSCSATTLLIEGLLREVHRTALEVTAAALASLPESSIEVSLD
mmetsp:Transcript_30354/g.61807  ORF Transcript_30354/g.61807 Transcript_30354/m.61807 type:complete len:459 (+) Transcript_30354:93-1469(+)